MSEQSISQIEENKPTSEDIEENQPQNTIVLDIKEKTEPDKLEPLKQEILLKLGDIVLIQDSTNLILNNKQFLIEYIDPTKIKLIDIETLEKIVLQISPDGLIGDGNISAIKIISSNPEKGFAKQNGLLPGTWINIYFGGDVPTVFTGEITNLEEDMIEIKTTDNDTIFINFAYQGIPDDLPIETFEIRPPVKRKKEEQEEQEQKEKEEQQDEKGEQQKEKGEQEGEQEDFEIPTKVVTEKIQQMFLDVNDLEFGETINVEEYVAIGKEKYRYNIETQTNDLLEEMVSAIPSYKRTNNVLNNIHTMITRFLQLRQISSTFDANKNITGIIKRTAEDRPLTNYLTEFKNTLYWIMMVAKNVKKIYPEKFVVSDRVDDYALMDLNANLNEISSLFVTNQSARNLASKYSSFTYKHADDLMTPFFPVSLNQDNNVFAKSNGIIVEGNVETNINAIIDNLEDLYSDVLSNSEIVARRFVIQRYNLASEKLIADNFKGQHLITHRVKITNNDPISINSMLTLPEPTVRFSQINLPGSNLLVKANLNMQFLNYWQLLKHKTKVTKIVIDGLDKEIEYDDTNFVDDIKQYILDLSDYNKPDDLSDVAIYNIFLKTIIPKIRILFLLIKKYIKGRLSLVDVSNYLEPFMIYPIDLTYKQYEEINKFIVEKIGEYNKNFNNYNREFSKLTTIKSVRSSKDKKTYIYENPLFNLLQTNKDLLFEQNIIDKYATGSIINASGAITISGSEFLKNIIVSDYGNLFNTAIAFTNIELMFPSNLSEVFNKDKERMKEIIGKDMKTDTCASHIISKKYYSRDELEKDNGKTIYYDKAFDTTNYELIEEKYKKERDNLDTEEFHLFLTNILQTKDKLNEASAEYMATTLIEQAKQVREGDYAILVTYKENEIKHPDQLEYYVRRDDIWTLDDKIDPSTFIKEDDILCNINYSCMYNTAEKGDNKCVSTEISKDTIVQNALKQIVDQFDKHYDVSKTELNTRINTQIEYFTDIFDKLQQLKKTQFLKYNNFQYELGLSISDTIKDVIKSPYIKLRDLIVGQSDFVKRQNDIITFVELYCRKGDSSIPNINDGEMENEWWLYCKETNTKLLPLFHHILAVVFVTKGDEEYIKTLDILKREIGEQSDDGDSWVDKNSGEVICLIDLDVTEGYKDGFVDKSRSIIEKDAGEVVLETQEKQTTQVKRLSREGQMVSNIVSTLAINMMIDIEQSRDFIIRVVTDLMNEMVISKKEAYMRKIEDYAKKGKTLSSYERIYASTILLLSLGVFLIGIQTSIPSIRTNKTAPGCIKSFEGFPIQGEGDDTSLIYVACVALKSRDKKIVPWNELPKTSEDIVKKVKDLLISKIMPYGEVMQKIDEKIQYLIINPPSSIPEEHDLSRWVNFLPPLKRFHISSSTSANVSEGFIDELKTELNTANHHQTEKILIIKSKIIAFSLAIQETIQKIVEKKEMLLKSGGQFFMDNACCNENGNVSVTSLQYFINNDRSIETNNDSIAELTSLLHDIKILTKSKIMLSEVDTKRKLPIISNDFSEETIYRAFIVLCKFNSSVPLSEELVTVCVDKPNYLKKMDTIQEKISKLKRDGRNYTKDGFLRLFELVSRNNIIKINLEIPKQTCVDVLSQILLNFDETDDENIPKNFKDKLGKLIMKYEEHKSIKEDIGEMRDLKNYLQSSIKSMKTELIAFIKKNTSKSELTNLTKFIHELNMSNWSFSKNVRNGNIKISDDALYNYTTFMKNFIQLFAIVFPSMIINGNFPSIKPPKYWGLAEIHATNVKEMVSEFYNPLEKYAGDPNIQQLLHKIMTTKSKGTYMLSQHTPILTGIKTGETKTYSVLDVQLTSLLYEYYLLSVLNDYIDLTKQLKNMTTQVIEDEDEFTTDEIEFALKDVNRISNLLVDYLKIMMKSKKIVDVSYKDIEDKIFRLKEAEKHDFTDRLKDLSKEGREVDTILKISKLGPLYSLGMSKGIKEYDVEHFEFDKKVAERVENIQKKLRKTGMQVDDVDIDDAIEEMGIDREIDEDAYSMNQSSEYNDGDPWGDEGDGNEWGEE